MNREAVVFGFICGTIRERSASKLTSCDIEPKIDAESKMRR